jgi:hypothetical protein
MENVDCGLILSSTDDGGSNTAINERAYGICATVPRDTIIEDGTLNPDAVKANAGIEPAYHDILSGFAGGGGLGTP